MAETIRVPNDQAGCRLPNLVIPQAAGTRASRVDLHATAPAEGGSAPSQQATMMGVPTGEPDGHAGHTPSRRRMRGGMRPFLLLGDLGAFGAAAVVVPGTIWWLDLLVASLTLVLFHTRGLYRPRLSPSVLADLPALAGRSGAATVLGALLTLHPELPGLPVNVAATGGVFLALVIGLRGAMYAGVRRARSAGWIAHPTLIVGAGRVGVLLAEGLREHPSYGLRPVGFLDSSPTVPADLRPLPLLGGEDSLARVIVEHEIHHVVVAFSGLPDSFLVDLVLTCDWLDCEIIVVPRLFELHRADAATDQVWGVPVIRLRRPAFRSVQWRAKRALDVAAAAVGLVGCAPIMAVVALAVRLEGGPGVLFRQERVGRGGRVFSLLKFRSMQPVDDTESAQRWSISDESRVGRIGRILRATSLDELPQLWNVMRGDMSLVGPRPERPYFVSEFAKAHPRYHARARVPAGMTGWAQVHGLRGDTSIEQRVAFDNFYITNWSLWLDLRILALTVFEVVRRRGS